MKKVVDIDLDNLPAGTKVKIVEQWRDTDGLQNQEGKMDKFLGTILTICYKFSSMSYRVYNDEQWAWHDEMFQAIQLPNSDVWYIIEYSNYEEKYVATLDEDTDIKPEEVIPVKQPESKYMVYVSGKASPKKVHNTYESACKEAHRLAGKEVGYVVSICKIEKQFISKIIVEEIE